MQSSYLWHIDQGTGGRPRASPALGSCGACARAAATVELNDTLYAQSNAFMAEVRGMVDIVRQEMLAHLVKLGETGTAGALRRQAELVLDYCERIACLFDVSDKKLAVLVVRFWKLAHKLAQPSVERRDAGILAQLRLLALDAAQLGQADLAAAFTAIVDRLEHV